MNNFTKKLLLLGASGILGACSHAYIWGYSFKGSTLTAGIMIILTFILDFLFNLNNNYVEACVKKDQVKKTIQWTGRNTKKIIAILQNENIFAHHDKITNTIDYYMFTETIHISVNDYIIYNNGHVEKICPVTEFKNLYTTF